MTPEVTKIVLNKIILNVWIENGPGIEMHFGPTVTYNNKIPLAV
jgi:hypothetical protein